MVGTDLRGKDRHYRYKHRCYPSVTLVLDMLDLHDWARRRIYSAACADLADKIESGETIEVWTLEEDQWQLTPVSALEALKNAHWMERLPDRELKRHQDRGSVLHRMLHDYSLGAAPDDSQLTEYVESLIYGNRFACSLDDCMPFAKRLYDWLERVKPRVRMAETACFNDDYGYGCTIDAVIDMPDGEPLLVDLKTSSSVNRKHYMQVAAQSWCDVMVCNDDARECPFDVRRGAILHLGAQTARLKPVPDIDYYGDAFVAALTAWRALRDGPTCGRETVNV